MRGRRAPELASGMLWQFLELAWKEALTHLTLKCRHILDTERWAKLLVDFSRGKAHCVYVLTIKLSNWTTLPWLLCGVAHCDESVARRVGSEALEKFTACPDTDAVHHR
eukprot:10870037-Alexandrium_andersonii.AAC.1